MMFDFKDFWYSFCPYSETGFRRSCLIWSILVVGCAVVCIVVCVVDCVVVCVVDCAFMFIVFLCVKEYNKNQFFNYFKMMLCFCVFCVFLCVLCVFVCLLT